MKAAYFLNNVDGKRYNGLRQRLEEGAMLGRDEYPLTLAHTYELLVEQNKNSQKRFLTVKIIIIIMDAPVLVLHKEETATTIVTILMMCNILVVDQ